MFFQFVSEFLFAIKKSWKFFFHVFCCTHLISADKHRRRCRWRTTSAININNNLICEMYSVQIWREWSIQVAFARRSYHIYEWMNDLCVLWASSTALSCLSLFVCLCHMLAEWWIKFEYVASELVIAGARSSMLLHCAGRSTTHVLPHMHRHYVIVWTIYVCAENTDTVGS